MSGVGLVPFSECKITNLLHSGQAFGQLFSKNFSGDPCKVSTSLSYTEPYMVRQRVNFFLAPRCGFILYIRCRHRRPSVGIPYQRVRERDIRMDIPIHPAAKPVYSGIEGKLYYLGPFLCRGAGLLLHLVDQVLSLSEGTDIGECGRGNVVKRLAGEESLV